MIHFVTTRPRADRCPRCRRLHLVGIAEGLPYRVDPAPLTALAEIVARVGGRETWWMHGNGLAWRNVEKIKADRIRGRPIVFADHRCARPVAAGDIDPTYLPFMGRWLAALTTGAEWSDAEMTTLALVARHLGARVIDGNTPPY